MSLHFCKECNNLLYPKQDKYNKRLLFACRICDFNEIAQDCCVYKNSLESKQKLNFMPDLAYDPTLPRHFTVTCGKCGFMESVEIHNRTHASMIVYLLCCHCGHVWKKYENNEIMQESSAVAAAISEAMDTGEDDDDGLEDLEDLF